MENINKNAVIKSEITPVKNSNSKVICFALLKSFFAKYLENSGISKLLKDFIKISGNIIIGRDIPFIIP